MNMHSTSLQYLILINIVFSQMRRISHMRSYTFFDVSTCSLNVDATIPIITKE
jgi:hypothetical protein